MVLNIFQAKNDATKLESSYRVDSERIESRLKAEIDQLTSRMNRLRDEKSRTDSYAQDLHIRISTLTSKVRHKQLL